MIPHEDGPPCAPPYPASEPPAPITRSITVPTPRRQASIHGQEAIVALRKMIAACPAVDKKLELTGMIGQLRGYVADLEGGPDAG